MIERATLAKTWNLLEPRQKTALFRLGIIVVLSALTSAAMVASVFPFLSLLSDPGWADRSDRLTWLREVTGLTSDYSFTVAAGIAAVALILLGSAMQILRNYAVVRFSQFLAYDLSRTLLGRYLAQPYIFSVSRNSSSLATNVLSESQKVVSSFVRPLLLLFASAVTLVAVLGTVIAIQPVLGASAFLLVGTIYGALLLITRRRVRQYGRRRAAANEARYRLSSEAFGGFKDIKLLARESA
jgi:ABC-type multidrug transport system fused ATPase/permease subunit